MDRIRRDRMEKLFFPRGRNLNDTSIFVNQGLGGFHSSGGTFGRGGFGGGGSTLRGSTGRGFGSNQEFRDFTAARGAQNDANRKSKAERELEEFLKFMRDQGFQPTQAQLKPFLEDIFPSQAKSRGFVFGGKTPKFGGKASDHNFQEPIIRNGRQVGSRRVNKADETQRLKRDVDLETARFNQRNIGDHLDLQQEDLESRVADRKSRIEARTERIDLAKEKLKLSAWKTRKLSEDDKREAVALEEVLSLTDDSKIISNANKMISKGASVADVKQFVHSRTEQIQQTANTLGTMVLQNPENWRFMSKEDRKRIQKFRPDVIEALGVSVRSAKEERAERIRLEQEARTQTAEGRAAAREQTKKNKAVSKVFKEAEPIIESELRRLRNLANEGTLVEEDMDQPIPIMGATKTVREWMEWMNAWKPHLLADGLL